MSKMINPPKYFVWRKNVRGGVSPEIWYDDLTTGHGTFQHKAVGTEGSDLKSFYDIAERHQGMSLEQLKVLYPYAEGRVRTVLK